jgi:hypothetical protein
MTSCLRWPIQYDGDSARSVVYHSVVNIMSQMYDLCHTGQVSRTCVPCWVREAGEEANIRLVEVAGEQSILHGCKYPGYTRKVRGKLRERIRWNTKCAVAYTCVFVIQTFNESTNKTNYSPLERSWAGIAQSVWRLATGWTVGDRKKNPDGGEIFANVRTGLGTHPASYTRGSVFPRGKAAGAWR